MPVHFARLATAGVLLALLSGQAIPRGATAQPVKADFSVRFLVAGPDTDDPRTAWAGVQVRLGPAWHTYWRSPGDAGAPPQFEWSDSRNVEGVRVEWPAPQRFSEGGIDTFGYAEQVVFPVAVRLQDPAAPAHVSLKLALYVCSTICTQNELQFAADILPGAREAGASSQIKAWRDKVPRERSPTLSVRDLRIEPGPRPSLRLEVLAAPPLSRPDAFVDGDDAVTAGPPQIGEGAAGSSIITLPLEGLDHANPNRSLHLTLVDGGRSLEMTLPKTAGSGAAVMRSRPEIHSAASGAASLWPMLALSLLGGLILNFMPCVFPVLSLKLMSLVQHASRDTRTIRAGLLASAAGIVASFVVLAVILAALKSAGADIGWGIQFQQPAFLVTMSAVLVALGANLIGLYEINLPWWLSRRLGEATGGTSNASQFVNGFVMTLLATPCSAPFVGTAAAFALSQGPLEIIAIFVCLGLGMASPYLLLTLVPRLAGALPRPGRWMLTLRRLSAAAMAATALWLLTVLADISGVVPALVAGVVMAGAVALSAVACRKLKPVAAGGIVVLVVGAAAVVWQGGPRSDARAEAQPVAWQSLDPDKVSAMVRRGRTVFVDIGASWCVTCKVNEKLVIDSDTIRRRLTSDVRPVRADWTRPDEIIASYLKSFGRYGLPFNAVFGPGAPAGIVLPEVLTQQAVLDAFAAAATSTPPSQQETRP